MSKGSNRRPSDVDGETFAQRWEKAFGERPAVTLSTQAIGYNAPLGYDFARTLAFVFPDGVDEDTISRLVRDKQAEMLRVGGFEGASLGQTP